VSELPRRELNARQQETVERLLTAGLDELRAAGHDGMTVRTVAQRAGVSPATAYTYLASKNHLFAELFWRHLAQLGRADGAGGSATERMQAAVRSLVQGIAEEPELATAVTPALLGNDPDVDRLRLRIGAQFVTRFEAALGDAPAPPLVDAMTLAFSGALLQAGMGLMTYAEMADRLDAVVAVIMRGNDR
jgi:AcrR family transcriptional regulator